jgi:DNA polymerase (family 10)
VVKSLLAHKVNVTLAHNKELALIFRQMSDCYRYLGTEHRFRANAYAVAAQTLENMQEPVDTMAEDLKKLDSLKGVGESIAEKIQEYLHTGQIATFEKLKKKVPYGLMELLEIEGIGPATLRTLHDQLKVNTSDELLQAIKAGRLGHLKGFAQRKKENLLRVLKVDEVKQRMPLRQAQALGAVVLEAIHKIPGIQQAALAGSLRRKKETVGDLDIILTADRKQWKKIMNSIIRMPEVVRVLAAGETKVSILYGEQQVQVDIRLVRPDEWGSALLYFTGSKEHNIILRTIARQKGWKVNEYGVFEVKSGKRLAGRTEEEIYALFGLPYIPPEKRVGKNELQAI